MFTCSYYDSPQTCVALGHLYANTNGAGWYSNYGWASAASGAHMPPGLRELRGSTRSFAASYATPSLTQQLGTPTDYCSFYGVSCSSASVLATLCVCRSNGWSAVVCDGTLLHFSPHPLADSPRAAARQLPGNNLNGAVGVFVASLTGLTDLCALLGPLLVRLRLGCCVNPCPAAGTFAGTTLAAACPPSGGWSTCSRYTLPAAVCAAHSLASSLWRSPTERCRRARRRRRVRHPRRLRHPRRRQSRPRRRPRQSPLHRRTHRLRRLHYPPRCHRRGRPQALLAMCRRRLLVASTFSTASVFCAR